MKIFLSILITLFFTGCFEDNPLIGKWNATKQNSIIKTIEFTDNKVIYSDLFEKVEYEISKDKVLVTGLGGIGTIYNIIDRNTISTKNIFTEKQNTYIRCD